MMQMEKATTAAEIAKAAERMAFELRGRLLTRAFPSRRGAWSFVGGRNLITSSNWPNTQSCSTLHCRFMRMTSK
jgi:hypothetical protein